MQKVKACVVLRQLVGMLEEENSLLELYRHVLTDAACSDQKLSMRVFVISGSCSARNNLLLTHIGNSISYQAT